MSKKSKKKHRNQKQNKVEQQNQRKKTFERLADETIDQCLARIEQAGYTPIRRIEKPIFKEVIENGEKKLIPDQQRIIFEVIMNKDER
ncbi:MAG TPA: NETI motif-containing protein [Bacilli bacterium]|nr:NETI motif-containing protein [Bacilli bacterium]